MAQQTICPACGAPLTYTGTAEEIRCPFCDTELQVLHEDGQERFRILSQPGPQKEVLSRPVEPGQRPSELEQRTVATFKSPAEAEQPAVDQPPVEAGQPLSSPQSSNTPTAEMPAPPNVEMPDIPAIVPPGAEDDFHNRATTVMRREDLAGVDLPREDRPKDDFPKSDLPKENFSKEDFTKEERPREVFRQEDSTRETIFNARSPVIEENQSGTSYPGFTNNEADRLRAERSVETVSAPEAPAFHKTHGPAVDVPVTGTAAAAPRQRSRMGPIIIALVVGLLLLMACAAGAWMVLSRFFGLG